MKQLCYLIRTSLSTQGLGGTGYFLPWNPQWEFEHSVIVFELLEEMVARGCRNGKFNGQLQIFPLELKVKFI